MTERLIHHKKLGWLTTPVGEVTANRIEDVFRFDGEFYIVKIRRGKPGSVKRREEYKLRGFKRYRYRKILNNSAILNAFIDCRKVKAA